MELKFSWNRTPKYRNKKIEADGMTFDSKKEYKRWCELNLLLKSGEITELERQVKIPLIPTQREPDIIGKRGGVKKGKVIEHEISYIADFVYKDKDGKLVVEDTKGFRTKEYVLKRKMLLFLWGIKITEL